MSQCSLFQEYSFLHHPTTNMYSGLCYTVPVLYLTTNHFVFRVVREHGGLVIADEVQCGMGRAGDNMWGFQDFGLVPDIVTVGKGLGNGFPMGAVLCSKEVSDRLGGYFSTFGGNPVACAIGMR